MGSGGEKGELTHDIATLRALINKLLDEGTPPNDPALVAASLVLSAKRATLEGEDATGT